MTRVCRSGPRQVFKIAFEVPPRNRAIHAQRFSARLRVGRAHERVPVQTLEDAACWALCEA